MPCIVPPIYPKCVLHFVAPSVVWYVLLFLPILLFWLILASKCVSLLLKLSPQRQPPTPTTGQKGTVCSFPTLFGTSGGGGGLLRGSNHSSNKQAQQQRQETKRFTFPFRSLRFMAVRPGPTTLVLGPLVVAESAQGMPSGRCIEREV